MTSPSTSQVRQWARLQGVPVGDRGRIPADLVAQYLAAHDPAARPVGKPPRPTAGGPSTHVVIGRTITAKPRWDWKR